MSFETALAALQQTHPNAELGASVQEGGHYYPAAFAKTYRRIDPDVFRSEAGQSRMWLYQSKGGIYCGPKAWPEYENA